MTNKVTDIPLKFVVIEEKLSNDKTYVLSTTPIDIKYLLNNTVYQLKPSTTLHKVYAKNRAIAADVLVGKDNIVVEETEETIEYINKADLEPYELSDYDKQRISKHNKTQNKLKFFDDMIFPSIISLIDTYRCVNILTRKNEIELSFNYAYATDNDKATKIKTAKEIVSKIKDLGCHITYHRCSNNLATIHKLKTVDNLQKLPK